MPVDITFLRTDDIPVLCAEGAIEWASPAATWSPRPRSMWSRALQLGVGHCRLAVCVPEDSQIQSARSSSQGHRVATVFPQITQRYLQQHHTEVHLVHLSGSVEIMIALGVADAIVDLVETGSTLAANRLRMLDEIGHYETVLIQNPGCRHTELADRVVRRLEGVVIARSYSLLEYNISP